MTDGATPAFQRGSAALEQLARRARQKSPRRQAIGGRVPPDRDLSLGRTQRPMAPNGNLMPQLAMC